MLGVVLALFLVIIVVACLVPNNWDCLVCLDEIMRCFSMQKHSIMVFSFDAYLYQLEGIPVLFLLRKAANVFLLTFNFLEMCIRDRP